MNIPITLGDDDELNNIYELEYDEDGVRADGTSEDFMPIATPASWDEAQDSAFAEQYDHYRNFNSDDPIEGSLMLLEEDRAGFSRQLVSAIRYLNMAECIVYDRPVCLSLSEKIDWLGTLIESVGGCLIHKDHVKTLRHRLRVCKWMDEERSRIVAHILITRTPRWKHPLLCLADRYSDATDKLYLGLLDYVNGFSGFVTKEREVERLRSTRVSKFTPIENAVVARGFDQ